MDENNQHGNAMTKPLPTDNIKKEKKVPNLREFNLIIQGISDQDKIGHLFVLDIEFDQENASEKNHFSTRSTLPFSKKKVLSANERSFFQLLDAMRMNDKGTMNSYKTIAKTSASMDKKIAISLYAEHLHLLMARCGWRVSNVRAHYTFEQSKFKKDFVIMNQVSSRQAKTEVKRDFYKLLNFTNFKLCKISTNFDFDWRNNADNCFFNPIFDEIEELSYAKKY